MTRAALVALALLMAAPALPVLAHGKADNRTDANTPASASYGTVRFANSGNAAAQASFGRGLAQLHNFEYDTAAAFFREAQAADPGFAMAYWGEAMTYNHPVWFEQDAAKARAVLARLGPTPAARAAANSFASPLRPGPALIAETPSPSARPTSASPSPRSRPPSPPPSGFRAA